MCLNRIPLPYGYIQNNIRQEFVSFLNPFHQIIGITYGIRIEIITVVLATFLYLSSKKCGLIRSISGSILVFLSCFFHISFTGLLKNFLIFIFPLLELVFKLLNPGLYQALKLKDEIEGLVNYRLVSMSLTLWLLCVATLWFALYNKRKLSALLKNIRLTRSLHYCFLVLVGLTVYLTANSEADLFIFIRVMSMLLAIFFAFQFSVVVNDLFDIESDRISNHLRPLVTGALECQEYLRIGWIYLAFSLLFAFWVSDNCLILSLGFILFYAVYSMPPLRLKRFFPISSFIIGIEALLAFLLGAFSLNDGADIGSFGVRLPLFVFLIFTLSSNIKDLKDIAGDKSSEIYTIPVIAGETSGRKIIGALIFLSYLLVPLSIIETPYSSILFVLSIIFGLINYLYLRRKGSGENLVFYLYFIYLFLLAAGFRLTQ